MILWALRLLGRVSVRANVCVYQIVTSIWCKMELVYPQPTKKLPGFREVFFYYPEMKLCQK